MTRPTKSGATTLAPELTALITPNTRQTLPRVAFRFLAGRPLRGGPRRSDATFWRPGRRYLGGPQQWRTRWDLVPGVGVLAVRLVLSWVCVVIGHGWVSDPSALAGVVRTSGHALRAVLVHLCAFLTDPGAGLADLQAVALVAGFALVVGGGWRLSTLRRRRTVLTPAALALAEVLGFEPWGERTWLRIPRAVVPTPPGVLRVASVRVWSAWVRFVAARHGRVWRALDRLQVGARPPRWWVRSRARVAVALAPINAWRRAHARIRVTLPHELGAIGPDVRTTLLGAIAAKIPGEWDPAWVLSGPRAALYLTRRVHPPTRVTFADARPALGMTGPTKFLLGLGPRSRPVFLNIDGTDPHVGVIAGSGSGKTVLLTAIEAAAVRAGLAVVLLDLKGDHRAALRMERMGLPIHYLHTPRAIHEGLIALQALREWRADMDFETEGGSVPLYQRVIIVADELAIMSAALRAYWERTRTKGQPKISPALTALQDISMAGRSASMHLVWALQHATARATGANDNTLKENTSTRVMASTAAAWRLLAHGHPVEARSRIPGRMHMVTPSGVTELQVPLISVADAVGWATEPGSHAGQLAADALPFTWDVTTLPAPGQVLARIEARLAPTPPIPQAEPAGPERVGLAEWCRRTGTRHEAARKRRLRLIARGVFTDTPDQRYTAAEVTPLLSAPVEG